jgi:hypothetical protein
MPASAHGAVQTDAHDGRKFITIKVGSNGKVRYRKVYLRTRNGLVARRRARVIEELSDVEEARAIIKYLAESPSPEVEKRRLGEVAGNLPLIPALTHDEARAELEAIVCDFGEYAKGDIPDEVVDDWRLAHAAEDQKKILVSFGVPQDHVNDNPSILADLKTRALKINPDFSPKRKAWDAFFRQPVDSLPEDRPARGPRVSECIREYETEQAQRGNIPRHSKTYVKRFRQFVEFTKDKHISALNKQDFVGFVDHVLAEKGKLSNKTIKDHLSPIKSVFECARTRMDDDVFPEAIDNWLRVIDREKRRRPYKPPKKNREPMPPNMFKQLLAKADEWARLDWESYAASLPLPDGTDRRRRALAVNRNKKHALYLKRVGLATHAMLCLAANVGAQAVDFSRLLWSELVLGGELPLYKESRSKPTHLLGSEVPRCCPLLSQTVQSLLRWREWQQAELIQAAKRKASKRAASGKNDTGTPDNDAKSPQAETCDISSTPCMTTEFVFTYADGRAMDQEKSFQVSTYFLKLRTEAKCTDWEVRHCRNIGSTVRRNARLPSDMANAWLGHSARETNRFYTGDAEDDYLLPLVQEIERRYFM